MFKLRGNFISKMYMGLTSSTLLCQFMCYNLYFFLLNSENVPRQVQCQSAQSVNYQPFIDSGIWPVNRPKSTGVPTVCEFNMVLLQQRGSPTEYYSLYYVLYSETILCIVYHFYQL